MHLKWLSRKNEGDFSFDRSQITKGWLVRSEKPEEKRYNLLMILKILRFPHPILKKKAKAVGRITPEIIKLIDNMIATMRAAPGVGLAAPQVGKSLQVIVAAAGEEVLALINPKIVKKSGSQTYTEGCLSLPGIEAPIERAAKITVKAMNREGVVCQLSAEGFLATILQHEIDHLNGLVCIDRVKDPSTIVYKPLEKEKKEELI